MKSAPISTAFVAFSKVPARPEDNPAHSSVSSVLATPSSSGSRFKPTGLPVSSLIYLK